MLTNLFEEYFVLIVVLDDHILRLVHLVHPLQAVLQDVDWNFEKLCPTGGTQNSDKN